MCSRRRGWRKRTVRETSKTMRVGVAGYFSHVLAGPRYQVVFGGRVMWTVIAWEGRVAATYLI